MISFCTSLFICCIYEAICPTQPVLIFMFTSPFPVNGFKFVPVFGSYGHRAV